MAFYLAFKEIWRNRGRFFLFSLVIALITTLVLFIAALAEGLAAANKEYLEKLDAQVIIFQKNVDLSANTSQIGRSTLNDILRVPGVEDIGAIGLSGGSLILDQSGNRLDVSLIGIEPGKPGNPDITAGRPIMTSRANEAVIDFRIAQQADVGIGSDLTIRTIQGTEEKFYRVRVIGITSGQQYLFRPSLFLPYRTWDDIRPQPSTNRLNSELVTNIVAVRLVPGVEIDQARADIERFVSSVEAVDLKTAYEAIPGYKVQQQTLNTQQFFTLLIGILVVGGFFQIQMLQKIPQIGVLKAIGASNLLVGAAAVIQIILVTTFGVFFGALVTAALALGIPGNVPIVFSGSTVAIAVAALLAIGPIGGLVTVRVAVGVEPLMALGLSS